MLKWLMFSGLLTSVVPAIAGAQTQPSTNADQASKRPKDMPERIICENEEQTGSRIASQRICMTAQQWKDHEQRVHSQLDEQHRVQEVHGPG